MNLDLELNSKGVWSEMINHSFQNNNYNDEVQTFWKIRADNYDKLFWAKDTDYIKYIMQHSDLNKSHYVLDVGTGTGIMAFHAKELAKHVVAIDISEDMLKKGEWKGISVLKWDIGTSLFTNNIFDRVIARMVFHHIMDNLDRAILRCYDILRNQGKIIIAEGCPPSDDDEVVDWYTNMFKLKENRMTFTEQSLVNLLIRNGFVNVQYSIYLSKKFSIKNWVENSGLSKIVQGEIIRMHKNANKKIKDVYQMEIFDDDCLITTKNIIIVGEKQSI